MGDQGKLVQTLRHRHGELGVVDVAFGLVHLHLRRVDQSAQPIHERGVIRSPS